MRNRLLTLQLMCASALPCLAQGVSQEDLALIPANMRTRYDDLTQRIKSLDPPTLPTHYPGEVSVEVRDGLAPKIIELAGSLVSVSPRAAILLLENWWVCLANNGYPIKDQKPWLDRIHRLSIETAGCWRLRAINKRRQAMFMATGQRQEAIGALKDTVARCLELPSPERPYLKCWLEINLARDLLYEVHRPLEALVLINRALRSVDRLEAPWPAHVVASLKKNFNIWVTDRNRARAATFEDTMGRALQVRGFVRSRLGADQDAIRDFEAAAELFVSSANTHRRLNCRHDTAESLYNLGRLGEAKALATQVREEYQHFRFADGRMDLGGPLQIDKILGHIARAQGDWIAARAQYDSCFEGFAHMTRAEYLTNPRRLHWHAMESLLYAAECRVRSGDTKTSRRDLMLARDHYSKEGDELRRADAQRILALLELRVGQLKVADRLIRKAESTFRRYNQLPLMTRCALTRGHILQRLGDHRSALESFADSATYLLKGMNDQTISQSEDASHAYRLIYRPAMDGILESLGKLGEPTPKDLDAAYRAVQVFHGFGLVGALNLRRDGNWMQQLPQAEREKYLQTREERRSVFGEWRETAEKQWGTLRGLKRKEDRVKQLENRLRTLDAAIQVHRDAAYSRLAKQGKIAPPQPSYHTDVAATVARGTVFVEFAAGDQRLNAFVFRGGKSNFVAVAGLRNIRESVGELHRAQDDRARERALAKLSQLILHPLRSYLDPAEDSNLLLISPDGDLCTVPFAALRIPGSQKRLVESWDLAYVHSGTVYRELVGQRESRDSGSAHRFVGFGDPTYKATNSEVDSWRGSVDIGHLKPLPGTRKEIQSVARVVKQKGGEATLFLGDRATERNMRESPAVRKATIIHLACHGIANRQVPSLSLLALSPEGEGKTDTTDGLLLMRELRDLRLRPRLLTLSACETNVGDLRDFEGTIGLTRAAIASGAEAVMSTLWRIPDEESTRLIVDFYTHWIAKGLNRPRALAEAQRAAIKRGAETSSWAAFTLWDIDR